MKIFNTADLNENSMKTMTADEASWVYNGLDVGVTAEIFNVLIEQLSDEPVNVQQTYAGSLAKLAPIMEMTLRGTYINEGARQRSIIELAETRRVLDMRFQRIMKSCFGGEVNWNSPTQLKQLFYNALGVKEVKKRNTKGQYTATVNSEALEHFQLYLYARPLAKMVLLLRDLHKQITFLKTSVDKDQRMRTSYNIAGTNTGRLTSSMSDFGTGANLQNVNRQLRFPFTADPGMYMLNIDLEQADGRNIGAVCWNMFYDATAADIAKALDLDHWDGPVGPEFAGTYLDAAEGEDLHTTVCKMVWPDLGWPADSSEWKEFCSNLQAHGQDSYRQLAKKGGHGCLTGDHEVLTPEGWKPIEDKPATILAWNPDSTEMRWENPSHWEDKPWAGDMYRIKGNQYDMLATSDHRMPVFTKRGKNHEQPAENLTSYSELNLRQIGNYVGGTLYNAEQGALSAAAMADANIYPNGSVRFGFSKRRKKERIIKLLGDRAYKITEYVERGETYYHLSASEVDFSLHKVAGPHMLTWSREALHAWVAEQPFWDGTQLPTRTRISGKSRSHMRWMQVIALICGQGASYQPQEQHDCARVGYSRRTNRRIGSLTIQKEEGAGRRVYCPTVPSAGFIYRYNGEVGFSLNTNYYGTPRTMAKHLHTSIKIVELFQSRYFGEFPCVKAFHGEAIRQVRETGVLTSTFGRRRHFFGRGNDASTHRKAIAYCGQSPTGEQIDRGLLQVWRKYPQVQLLNQVHDSILLQVPFSEAAELTPLILEEMRVTLKLTGGRDFTIPLDAAGGWNWGYEDKLNPHGLSKWKGAEDRTRPSPRNRMKDYL